MKKILLILLGFVCCVGVYAQEETVELQLEELSEDEVFASDTINQRIDSLLSLFYIQNRQIIDTTNYFDENTYFPSADLPDSVYIQRLSKIASVVHLPYNDIIRRTIVLYTQKMRSKTEEILSLSGYYFPIFEEILHSYNLPLELKTMAVIESALNPTAVSRVGATGPWQFMFRTAKYYGLQITSYVDERRDPIVSCDAAARYMRDMYDIFGDWTLVIASYNCGAGNVNKAIRRAGGKTDYWSIYPYLPRETRGYVPLFVGATYAMTYYKEHGLISMPATMPFAVDTFMISQMLHFEQISAKLGIPIETLQNLNPQYRRDIIPGKEKPYPLILPHNYTLAFVDHEKDIYEHNSSVYFNNNILQAPADDNYAKGSKGKGGNKQVHVVRKGDTVGGIARKYRVSQSNLRAWNNIKKNNIIRAGQKLVVYR